MKTGHIFAYLLLSFASIGAGAGSSDQAPIGISSPAMSEANLPSIVFTNVAGLESAKSQCFTPNGTVIGSFQIGDGPCSVPGGRVAIRPKKMTFRVNPGKIIVVKHSAIMSSRATGRTSEWYQEQVLVQGVRNQIIDDDIDSPLFSSHVRLEFVAGSSKNFQHELIDTQIMFQDQPSESDGVLSYKLTLEVSDGAIGRRIKYRYRCLDCLAREALDTS